MADNNDTTYGSKSSSSSTAASKPAKPVKLRLAHPDHNKKVIATFEGDYAEKVARRHVELNFPRGREVYLEYPDGSKKFYAAESEEDDKWADFEEDE